VIGEFEVGAAVEVIDSAGTALARALVNYSSGDIRTIQGHHSHEIANLLGHKDFDEVAHRDNLVLL